MSPKIPGWLCWLDDCRYVSVATSVKQHREMGGGLYYCIRSGLLLLSIILVISFTGQTLSEPTDKKLPSRDDDPDSTNLGVRVLRPVYAIVPETRNGLKNVTVVMTLWLKRVGAAGGPFDMPHQAQDAIRIMLWVDNPTNLFQRTNGHLLLPTEPEQWAPTLSLETAEPGPVLPVTMETTTRTFRRVWGVGQRPYSYRVDLPPGVGDCFKIKEASYPMHKHTFCLQPAAKEYLCSVLAPADVYNPSKPALYTVIGPIRHSQSSREWGTFYTQTVGRLVNYVSYHVAMGLSGLLLYADEMMRKYYRESGNKDLLAMIEKGHIRLIEWDLPERAHNNTDGVGRPLGYNYDQGLVASHSLLGLSGCGVNLLVLNADIDEFVYFPRYGRKWPSSWTRCMGGIRPSRSGGWNMETLSKRIITVHRLQRYETLTKEIQVDDERGVWTVPGTLDTKLSPQTGILQTKPTGVNPHPLAHYDVIYRNPLPKNMVKQISMPAAWIVLFWVHEGPNLHGKAQLVHHRCFSLLHISNFFRGRRFNAGDRDDNTVRPFRHWLFLDKVAFANQSALWDLP